MFVMFGVVYLGHGAIGIVTVIINIILTGVGVVVIHNYNLAQHALERAR